MVLHAEPSRVTPYKAPHIRKSPTSSCSSTSFAWQLCASG
jgi:hypothetical protein